MSKKLENMKIKASKRALLDKLSIIDQTDDDHWLLEPIHVALESMDELEVYKKALDMACELTYDDYGLDENHFLQKAREE